MRRSILSVRNRSWRGFSLVACLALLSMLVLTSLHGEWRPAYATDCGVGTYPTSTNVGTGGGSGTGTGTGIGTFTVTVTAAPSTVPANGSTASTISATVMSGGARVSSALIHFNTTLGVFLEPEPDSQDYATATASNGTATANLVSSTDGTATVHATLLDSAGFPVVCPQTSVTFTPNQPDRIQKGPGDFQVAAPGAQLPAPIVARVLDSVGRPKAGVTVGFTTSKGTLSNASMVTDSSGRASTQLTLSSTSPPNDPHTVTASCAACLGTPKSVTFTATTRQPDKIVKVSGAPQFGVQNTQLKQPFAVVVVDASGRTMSGVTVQFAASKGTLSALNATTDANGKASVSLTLGSEDAPPVIHSVTATCNSCDTIKSVVFNATALRTFPFSGSVRAFDTLGQPMAASAALGAIVVINQPAVGLSFDGTVNPIGTFTIAIVARDGAASVTKDGFLATGGLPLSMSNTGTQSPDVVDAVLTIKQVLGGDVSGNVRTQLGVAISGASIDAFQVTSAGAAISGAVAIQTLSNSLGNYSFKAPPNIFLNIFAAAPGEGEDFVDLNNDNSPDVVATGPSGVSGQDIVFPATINLTGTVRKNGDWKGGPPVVQDVGIIFGLGVGTAPKPGGVAIGADGTYSMKLSVPASGANIFIINAMGIVSESIPREVRVNSGGQCLDSAGLVVACIQNFDIQTNIMTVRFVNSAGTSVTVGSAIVSATSSTTVAGQTLVVPFGGANVTNASVTTLELVSGDQALGVTSVTYNVRVLVGGFGELSNTSVTVPGAAPAPNPTLDVVVPVPLLVTGTVRDSTGSVIPAASIEINSTTLGFSGTTAGDGTYSVEVSNLAATYRITASKVGFLSSTVTLAVSGNVTRNFMLQSATGKNTISGVVSGAAGVSKRVTAITSDGLTFSADTGATGPNCGVSVVTTPNHFCITVGRVSITSLKASADGFVFDSVVNRSLPIDTTAGSVGQININLRPALTGRPRSYQCGRFAGCRAELTGSRIVVLVPPGAAGGVDDTLTVTIKETSDAPETATFTPTLTSAGVTIAVDITIRNSLGVLITDFVKPITFRIEPAVAGSLTGFYNASSGNWVPLNTCSNDASGTTCTTLHLSKFTMFSARVTTPAPTPGPAPGGGGGGGGAPGAPSPGPATLPPGTPPGPTSTAPSASAPASPSGATIGVNGGATQDGGISASFPAGALPRETQITMSVTSTVAPGAIAPSGSAMFPVTVQITPAAPLRLEEAFDIFVNLTASQLAGRNVSAIQGGVLEANGTVTPLPTRIIDLSAGLIAIRGEHLSTFVLFEVTRPGPVLTAPAYNTQLPGLGTTLSWTNPTGTTQYEVRVVPFNDDGPGIDLIRNVESAYTVMAPDFGSNDPNYVMLPGMSYTWQVRTTPSTKLQAELTEADWTAWSVGVVITAPVDSKGIELVAPQPMETVANLGPALVWRNTDKAVFYYEIQVSKDASFGPDAFLYWELRHGGLTSPLNSYTIPQQYPLEPGLTYHWRVRPRVQGDGGPLDWGATFSFKSP